MWLYTVKIIKQVKYKIPFGIHVSLKFTEWSW
jgi:hypothetical protein